MSDERADAPIIVPTATEAVRAVLWWLGFDARRCGASTIVVGDRSLRVVARGVTFGGPDDFPADEVVFDSEEGFMGHDLAYVVVDRRWVGWVVVPNLVYAAADLVRRKGKLYFSVPKTLTLSRHEFLTWVTVGGLLQRAKEPPDFSELAPEPPYEPEAVSEPATRV